MSIKKYHKSKNLLDMSDSTFRVSTLNCSYSKGILALSGTILEVGSTNQNWKDYLSFYLDAGTYSLNTPPELRSNYGRYLRKYDDDSSLISPSGTEVTLTERTRVYIGLYISNKTLNDQLAFMCNEGSTPLPYEPYDPEVWHSVPCRKYTKSRNSNSAWVDVPSYTRTNGTWVRDSDTWCYGFKVLKTSDDPDLKVEYLEDAVGMTPASMGLTSFNYGSWPNAPFMPKACMLNFDGTVAYYLDPDDYSKKLDGTPSDVSNFDFNGNAMAEYGLLWYKFSDGDENTEFEFRVSNKKLDDDFVCHCNTDSHNDIIDHFYVPIYNGTTAPTYDSAATYDVGAHVVYDGKEYRCKTAVSTAEAFDNSKWDLVSNTPRMRSLSGVQLTPANGNGLTSGTEEIARAEACNVGADKEWFIDTLCDHELITMLHVLVAKSLDCQAKFGQGISSGSQTAKESYVTGSLDDKGSFYGSISVTTIAVKTFCRENFWALVWRRLAGLVGSSGNFLYKLTPNTADGSTATTYNTNGAGYLNGGVRPANGCIKNLKRSTDSFLPSTTASSSVGTKDYYYDGNGYALIGGYSNSGAGGGPFSFYLYYDVSVRAWSFSGSPSCKPCKNKTL